jgi:6-phosphofructokinase
VPNGIGIVKLMGRHAGFIAAHATLASGDVDLCLVPEVPIELDGNFGVLPHLERVLAMKGRAVVVVAEGAGEELVGTSTTVDAGDNQALPEIGPFFKQVSHSSSAKSLFHSISLLHSASFFHSTSRFHVPNSFHLSLFKQVLTLTLTIAIAIVRP